MEDLGTVTAHDAVNVDIYYSAQGFEVMIHMLPLGMSLFHLLADQKGLFDAIKRLHGLASSLAWLTHMQVPGLGYAKQQLWGKGAETVAAHIVHLGLKSFVP